MGLLPAPNSRHWTLRIYQYTPLARDALTDPVTIGIALVGRKMENPRVKGVLQTVVIAGAGLLLAAVIPTSALLLTTEIDTLWIIRGAAVISLSAASLGLIHPVLAFTVCPGLQVRPFFWRFQPFVHEN